MDSPNETLISLLLVGFLVKKLNNNYILLKTYNV